MYLFVSFAPLPECQTPVAGPTGSIIDHTGCKDFQRAAAPDSTPPDQDCIEYEYDGGSVLSIRHVNAGFNCCPVIVADIRFEGNTIVIEELDSLFEGGCDCLCLFDVDYEIGGLPPGEYRILVIEPYRAEEDPELDITVDLSSSPSGSHCVDRSRYPWGY